MFDSKTFPARLCLDSVMTIRKQLQPILIEHKRLERDLAKPVRKKATDHFQYRFDLVAHDLILKQIQKYQYNIRIFSEESGWHQLGSKGDYIILTDPFDQSFLTTKSIREACVAICVTDQNFNLLACVIADLNTNLTYFTDNNSTYIISTEGSPTNNKGQFAVEKAVPSSVSRLRDAFVIFPAMKRKRRAFFCRSSVTSECCHILNTDGIINIGRLAGGYIDAYIDPFIGKPIYEIAYAVIAQKAGAIVTDPKGVDFDLAKILRSFSMGQEKRYKFIASCSEPLHIEILEALEHDHSISVKKHKYVGG